jgi:hypothetical protein
MDFDLTVDARDLSEVPHISGVYVFYSEDGVCLYVGKSMDLHRRICEHLFRDAFYTRRYNENFKRISFIFHNEIQTLGVLEQRIINELKPVLNGAAKNVVAKIYLNKNSTRTFCNGKNKDGAMCKYQAKFDGYCSLHRIGYNPPTRSVGHVTSVIEAALDELDTVADRNQLFIYMNRETLEKLKSETNNCRLDRTLEIPHWRYKKHHIILNESFRDIDIQRYKE